MKKPRPELPTTSALRKPILESISARGGEATNEEIREDVVRSLGLTPKQTSLVHDAERGRRTELDYRLAWSRTYLSKQGKIERRGRGRWVITDVGISDITNDSSGGR